MQCIEDQTVMDFNLFFCSYFKDGLKTIAHFGTYIHDLSTKLNSIKQKQDDERRKLLDLRTLLRSAPDFERVEVSLRKKKNIHALESYNKCFEFCRI